MPVDVLLVLCLSAGIIGFAFGRGSRPEMAGGAIVAFNMAVDLLVHELAGGWNFRTFDGTRFMIDLIELGMLFALAMKANRVWPIFSAAAQLVAVGGSLAVLQSDGGHQMAYWAITQLPFFGQIAALAIGTLLHMRRQSAIGAYRDWRLAFTRRHR